VVVVRIATRNVAMAKNGRAAMQNVTSTKRFQVGEAPWRGEIEFEIADLLEGRFIAGR
jgi:hypothetical protein